MPFTFFGTKQHPFNPRQEVAGFEAQMTIDRLAYQAGKGKFYEAGAVGKDVDVLITSTFCGSLFDIRYSIA